MASRHAGGASLGNGRYELGEPIATGGMATVYKAWDTRVERVVAVKILRSLAKTDRRAIERFRREAHAAARLSHPNAVTIYDFLEEQGEHYLIMEYVDGVNLKQYLAQKGRLAPGEAVQIAGQICSVLQVAHTQGFIHRDIKPQNIMITRDGQAKLTDFGIVRVMEAAGLTNTGIVLGTADYLSPEQARGEPLSPASDLYSLGVVLYEMLAGRPPFVGSSAVQVAMQHANNLPPPPSRYNPRIPKPLELVVKQTLQKAPERRYSDADAMRRALRSSLKKSIEEGVTIPSNLPAVEPNPNQRITAPPPASTERPAQSAPGPLPLQTASPSERQMAPPAGPAQQQKSARLTGIVITLAILLLLGTLAVGAYLATRKSDKGSSLPSQLAAVNQRAWQASQSAPSQPFELSYTARA